MAELFVSFNQKIFQIKSDISESALKDLIDSWDDLRDAIKQYQQLCLRTWQPKPGKLFRFLQNIFN